jgi:histidinol-phosphate aminotransferase
MLTTDEIDGHLSPGALALLRRRRQGMAALPPTGARPLPPPKAVLAHNENVFGPSPAVVEAVSAWLGGSQRLNRYPETAHLRSRLAAALDLHSAMVAVGNGSNELLELVARTFLSPGVEAICSQWAYAMFGMVTILSGASLKVVPARDWGHDLGAMRAAITDRTRVVFLANPNNPTASMFSNDDLRRLLEDVPKHVIVVLDEAYREYVADLPGVPDGVRLLPSHPNLVVTRTFSKAYGLAGLRVGYALAAPEWIEALQSSGQPHNLTGPGLVAAEAALSDPRHLDRVRAGTRALREELVARLREVGVACLPSSVNFVLAHVGANAPRFAHRLAARGIHVAALPVYGLMDHVRITVGTEQENAALVRAIAEVQSEGSAP